jgi:hypothetical protein
VGKKVVLIDPVPTVAKSVRQYLLVHDDLDRRLEKSGICRYYVSDMTDDIKRQALRIFRCDGILEMVSMDA